MPFELQSPRVDGDPTLEQKRPQLVDHRRAPCHESIAHSMKGLEIELLGVFSGTNHIVGRCTASTIPSASSLSFLLLDLT